MYKNTYWIGIKPNDECLADENQRWLNSQLLENLGTFQGYWEAAHRQAGFQAGQYFNVSYLETWAKTPTATLNKSSSAIRITTFYLS